MPESAVECNVNEVELGWFVMRRDRESINASTTRRENAKSGYISRQAAGNNAFKDFRGRVRCYGENVFFAL
jgi:hypothetical protein